jgi:hypothetical protein
MLDVIKAINVVHLSPLLLDLTILNRESMTIFFESKITSQQKYY